MNQIEQNVTKVDELWQKTKSAIENGDPHTAEALLADTLAALKQLNEEYSS